ncbi:alanine--glyoxylate aminotransferase 2, mitochondrial isoform X2 [Loxodonta africana]|uniref:alanine--glyoxylate aminotransferase 2, mitochondrial isoform X2 n=1 Tax=Loxodonta africana TaxID=9785 RepID=UPI000C8137F0|nr:alanine--glyoxylate aminotransferase 2, mitochondrial isoform X2 [Loxodonta africana]XP_049718072.1 alanine--glyoxylate aminotransferase 2, mitochondrial isoform X2 [Elephas maximus indicus]
MTLAWRHLPRALCLETSSLRIPKMCPFLSLSTFWTSGTKLSLHTKPRMPPCDFTPERYKTLSYNRVLEIHKQHLSPVVTAYFQKPLLLHQGHMEWLFDFEGNRYLDFFSGVVTVSVGHCHPKVNAAAQKQLTHLWHTSTIFFHPPMHEYAEKLSALLPEPLKVIFLTNSGSEANDLAMLMARAHSNNTDIISFRGAYHGCSPYTLGLTNVGSFKMKLPSGMGCQATMCPDVFRGPWGGSHCRDSPVQTIRKCNCAPGCCQAKDQYIEQFKDTLNTAVAKSIAGFFAEPIQGVNGVVQYPKGFLKEAFQLVRQRGGVCIADEVIKEDSLQENSQEVGTYMLLKFAKLRDEFEIVGDVRGKGLMIGIEMVKDKMSRQPLPHEEINQIHEDCKEMGLLIGRGGIFSQTFRIAPAMCITKPEVDFAVEVFRSALIQHMERRAK